MKWFATILFGFFGMVLGGPLGLLLGCVIGYALDQQLMPFWRANLSQQQTNAVQKIFFTTTFQVMGHIAKADGRVSEQEIRAARYIMQYLGLNDEMKQWAIQSFNDGKQSEFHLDAALNQLRSACRQRPSLLHIFTEIQWQMVQADGVIHPNKQKTLQYICEYLGISSKYTAFRQQHGYGSQQPYAHLTELEEAYQLLGLSKHATNAEIKKSYRKLMSENHPDRLIAKGLPPEMIKVATEKTQRIKAAYETIKKTKGGPGL